MATSWGNAMESAVAWTPVLLDAAAKGVVIMAVAAGAAYAMRRASAAARHLAWGLALGGLLVLPVLSAALPAWRVLPEWAEMGQVKAATAQAPAEARRVEGLPAKTPATAKNVSVRTGQRVAVRTTRPAQGAALAAARATVQPARRLSAAEIAWMVLLAWAAGALIATLPVLAGAFAIWRVRRGSRRISDAEWAAALREAKERLGLRRSVILLESPRQAMPMVWGVFRTKLLVPAEAQGWTEGRRSVVLLHELAHAKRWDCLTRLAARVACAAHWFNPLAWLGYRLLQAESERACDDLVLAAGSRPADYAGHILAIVSRAKGRSAEVHAAIAMARTSNLEGRLRAILDEGRSRRALTRMAIAAAAIVLAAVVVPLSMMKTAAGEAKKAGAEAKAAATADAPKGTVVNEKGQPIGGAEVILYYVNNPWGYGNGIVEKAMAGADGAFALAKRLEFKSASGTERGDHYVLFAKHPDYAFAWRTIVSGAATGDCRLTMTEAATAEFLVADKEEKPLAGAKVWIMTAGSPKETNPLLKEGLVLAEDAGIVTAVTDKNGRAKLANLPRTTCTFFASLDGYGDEWSRPFGPPVQEIPFVMKKAGTVAGRVVTEEGKPVADAVVWFDPQWGLSWRGYAVTDKDGRYKQDRLTAKGGSWVPNGGSGKYTVSVTAGEYSSGTREVELEQGQTANGFDFVAVKGTLVKVKVLDGEANTPVSGAQVSLIQASTRLRLRGYSDKDGAVEFRLPEGEATVSVLAPPGDEYMIGARGGDPRTEATVLAKGGIEEVTLYTQGKANKLTTVTGRVVLPDGTPAAGIHLTTTNEKFVRTAKWIGPGNAHATTAADGSFTLEEVPAGMGLFIYGVTDDLKYALAKVMTPSAEPNELKEPLVMQPTVSCDIVIADDKGNPKADMALKIKPSMWGNFLFQAGDRNVSTDGEGRLKAEGIVPGLEYFVRDARANLSDRNWSELFYKTMALAGEPGGAAPTSEGAKPEASGVSSGAGSGTEATKDDGLSVDEIAPEVVKRVSRATLANGVWVEFVAVTKTDSGSRDGKWWMPNGEGIGRKLYDWMGVSDPSGRGYDFVIRRGGTPCVQTQWRVGDDIRVNDFRIRPMLGGREIADLTSTCFRPDEGSQTATLYYGVAVGPWRQEQTWGSFGSYPDGAGGTISALGTDTDKGLFVVVNHNRLADATRVTATDRAGAVHVPQEGPRLVRQGMVSYEMTFAGLKKQDVRSLAFETCPFEWVRFDNVSLVPGQITQLTASMEAPGGAAEPVQEAEEAPAPGAEAAGDEGIPPAEGDTAEVAREAKEASGPDVERFRTSNPEWNRYRTGVPAPNKVAVVEGCRIDIGGGAGMDFVLISAGTFEMGSSDGEDQEGPAHRVTITKPFYLGKYEVTQAQWAAVMGSNPSFFKGDNLPVDSVSWNDCQEFLQKLNEIMPGHSFRLPTEAEWEYACRAGTTGDENDPNGGNAWVDTTSDNMPHAVGQLQPNAWGLYDMHGNVWEWCSDWFNVNSYSASPANDPRGPETGDKKVMRGGSWSNPRPYSRSAKRGFYDPAARPNNTGLRVAWTAEASAATSPSIPRPNEALLSEESIIEIGSTARMDFVLIRPGTFEMGSVDGESDEQPVHRVAITTPFYLGKYEVTQTQWVAVMDDNPSVFKGDDLPVDSVSWYDCQEFLKRLNEMAPGHNFRLPTEAEREYACRAGTTTRYSFGDSEAVLGQFAWVDTTTMNQPHPVGKLQPNPWGLYDMHGNMWEWCSDWHSANYYAQSPPEDPQGPDESEATVWQGAKQKVLRGGSWSNPGPYSRSANRGYFDLSAKHNNYGLRVAWTEPGSSARQPAIEEGISGTEAAATEGRQDFTGKVLDLKGRPLENAMVIPGPSSNYTSSRYGTIYTDDGGKFSVAIANMSEIPLTVQKEGFSPEVKVARRNEPVAFLLSPGHTIRGRVVGVDRNPLPGIGVLAMHWRGYDSINFSAETDSDGRFLWDSAPEDEVTFIVHGEGYVQLGHVAMTARDEEYTITVRRNPLITGTVVDAGTGEPIERFTVTYADAPGGGGAPRWNLSGAKTFTDGKYEMTFQTYGESKYLLRVDAPGYKPEVSSEFSSTEGDVTLQFTLTKGGPLSGIVRTADGKPAAEAEMALATGQWQVEFTDGKVSKTRSGGLTAKTDEQGRFEFPAQVDECVVVALHDAGYAVSAFQKWDKPIEMTLAPWGRVEGTLMVGSRVGANEKVGIYLNRESSEWICPRGYPKRDDDVFWPWFWAQTDDKGHFAFSRVPAEEVRLGRFVVNIIDNPIAMSVESGKTAKVTVGGKGRAVLGRVVVRDDRKYKTQWEFRDCSLRQNNKHYGFPVAPDGTFRIDDVTEGEWEIFISVYQPQGAPSPSERAISQTHWVFTVPEMAGGRSDEGLVLPDIELTIS